MERCTCTMNTSRIIREARTILSPSPWMRPVMCVSMLNLITLTLMYGSSKTKLQWLYVPAFFSSHLYAIRDILRAPASHFFPEIISFISFFFNSFIISAYIRLFTSWWGGIRHLTFRIILHQILFLWYVWEVRGQRWEVREKKEGLEIHRRVGRGRRNKKC